jgi:hypothetical protein
MTKVNSGRINIQLFTSYSKYLGVKILNDQAEDKEKRKAVLGF